MRIIRLSEVLANTGLARSSAMLMAVWGQPPVLS
jgi:predicted DNA-binding transcriptional regulator AlpA